LDDEVALVSGGHSGLDEPVCLESIRFKMSEQQFVETYKDFWSYVTPVLSHDSLMYINSLTADFSRNKLGADRLFSSFVRVFGPVLVYKYFFLFCGTIENQTIRKTAQETLQLALRKLKFRHDNFIQKAVTWEDYFEDIKNMAKIELLWRISEKKIDLRQKILIEKERLFQLIGSVRKSTFQELIHWKYLNNFLSEVDSKTRVQRALLVPETKSSNLTGKLSDFDLLIVYAYFELVTQKMDGLCRGFNYEFSQNQNLMKRFMRSNHKESVHFDYDCTSDNEDYSEACQRENKGESEGPKSIMKKNRPFKDLISSHPDANSKSEFEQQPKPKAGQVRMDYINESIKHTKMEDYFPTLEDSSNSTSLFERMNAKNSKAKQFGSSNKDNSRKSKPVSKPEIPKKKHFVFKDDPTQNREKSSSKSLDLEKDFPALPSDSNADMRKVRFNVEPMKITKTTDPPFRAKNIDLEKDFPEIENEEAQDSLFARMNAKREVVKTNKKTKASKRRKVKEETPPKEEIVKRNERQSGKIRVDFDYALPEHDPSDVGQDQIEHQTEPTANAKNPAKCEFPSVSETDPTDNSFQQRFNLKKEDKIKDLFQKYGYAQQPVSKPAEPSNSEIIGGIKVVKKKKNK
jgi:hypothetical protein